MNLPLATFLQRPGASLYRAVGLLPDALARWRVSEKRGTGAMGLPFAREAAGPWHPSRSARRSAYLSIQMKLQLGMSTVVTSAVVPLIRSV